MAKSDDPTLPTLKQTPKTVKKNRERHSKNESREQHRDRQRRPPSGLEIPISDDLRMALRLEMARRGRGADRLIAEELEGVLGYKVDRSLIGKIARGDVRQSVIAGSLANLLGMRSFEMSEQDRAEWLAFKMVREHNPSVYREMMRITRGELDNVVAAIERIRKIHEPDD